jgi:hypothetical protein
MRDNREIANFIRRVADYEKISGILWLTLSIVQIISLLGIVAGIWNLFAARSRFEMAKLIRVRDPSVPGAFGGMSQLVIIGILNLILGGVIGILFVCLDFWIRDQVLSHQALFVGPWGNVNANHTDEYGEPSPDALAQVERLAALKDRGILSHEEYLLLKRNILDR